MWSYLRRKWQSLVFRLLFYFVLAILALAIALTVSFAKRFRPQVENTILPNLGRYIEYLVEDIGYPPDLRRAAELAEQLPFEIRIEGQGVEWSSNPGIGPIDEYRLSPAPKPHDRIFFGRHRRNQYLVVQARGYSYLFAIDDEFRRGSERRHWILFASLGLILAILYIAIRRMLRPIEAISRQVEKIGEGDLEQQLNTQGGSELARLADGVNHMSGRIKSMLESKSALLLAISHELRSPMTRMRVNLELQEPNETRQKLIDDLREMESLVTAILESERLNSSHAPLNLGRCQLLRLVEDVVSAHPQAGRIRTRLTPVEMIADELRLRLLLKNLIDNACHYSKPSDGLVEVVLECTSDQVRIEVRDQGIGIEARELPRLTEAFYRPDDARGRATGGYGLGLYLCMLVVDAHRGRMTIESEPGEGTLVAVELPLDNS